ncbi:hypothetical protein C441_09206 [Haloferax sulfurifontis ATCC BAA-897]|uniref:Uncharacterized protein n=1 Tax=Haloferax sulfurifontis ATCC BAA-897 TaxID=662480 RepID=M0IB34_9EURY|nr:hypothetical protein C441_09206 [Haloferax sulfurifontis ATCC BAA-897]
MLRIVIQSFAFVVEDSTFAVYATLLTIAFVVYLNR